MATDLKSIKALIEVPDTARNISDYKETELLLNTFYGGKDRGRSLQLGFYDVDNNYRFIQLDNEAVKVLIEELQNAFL